MKTLGDITFVVVMVILMGITQYCADKRVQYTNIVQPKITLVNPVKFDTASGIIVCIDTIKGNPHGHTSFWIRGYEVTTWDMVSVVHVALLDSNLIPIKYIGWFTK